MKREMALKYKFVEYIPEDLVGGTIYVSMTFATVAHKCCCGCGNEVITPLSPTDWKLTFDGKSISLNPSIGNWSFACQSHYWISHNRVRWASQWSQEEIHAGRFHDSVAKKRYFDTPNNSIGNNEIADTKEQGERKPKENFLLKLKKWMFS